MKSLFLIVFSVVFSALNAQQPATLKNPVTPSPADTNWVAKVIKTNEEWKKVLTPNQYYITREEGTESPFTKGNFNDNHEKGMYYCVSCQNPLFSSLKKFDSGTGWPSFWQAYSTKSIHKSSDNSLGMQRDEISCQRCNAHLGHVFTDGPKPTGLRYCMDGLALLFVKGNPTK